jgi:hypothetical protein
MLLMDGIALAWSDVPLALIEQHGLQEIAHDRGGERELWFLRRSNRPLLPVWHDGQLEIVRWGRKGGGLTWQRTVDDGQWVGADLVEIRAASGLDNGIWFRIHQGVRGLLVRGEAYVIVEPSSYYYRVMTRRDRMPVLIGERI